MYITTVEIEHVVNREQRECVFCGGEVEEETVLAVAYYLSPTNKSEDESRLGYVCDDCFVDGEDKVCHRMRAYAARLVEENPNSAERADLLEKLAGGAINVPPGVLLGLCRDDAAKVKEQARDGHMGMCPLCRTTDGYLVVWSKYWMVCHEHRKRWLLKRGVLSESHLEGEGTWRRNWDQIADYEEVQPVYPDDD